MKKDTISVGGMSCGHCEIAVQDAVGKLPGMKKVKASKRKGLAVVEYEPELVSLEQIRGAIADVGFEVGP